MSLGSKPSYLRTFSGIIWKIVYDPNHLKIALEVRSESELDVFYFIIDLEKNETYEFRSKNLDWWCGIKGIFNDELIFIKHQNQTNPGPGDLIILNCKTDKVSHLESEFLIESINNGKIAGFKHGEEVEEKVIQLQGSKHTNSMYFPVAYSESAESFEIVKEYVNQEFKKVPVDLIEYLELDDNIFFAYYTKEDDFFTRFFCWVKNERILAHFSIDKKMKGVALESFFILGKFLIFVKDRNTLEIHEI